MARSYKIAIVIPYMGKWPVYFDLYLKGCAANGWLDVIIFTDCPVPEKHPDNVRFIPSSLKKTSELATLKLGAALDFQFGYKLCDLRPFYGIVFEDYLAAYDFWGYGDIDLIYGNLAQFIIPRIKGGAHLISSRRELFTGSFALLRNTPDINNLGKTIPDYRQFLQSKNYECLDETAHSNIVWQGGSKLELPNHSFTKIIAQAAQEKKWKVSFETICKEHLQGNEQIRYSQAGLFFNNESLGYFHYVTNKNKPGFVWPTWKKLPDTFIITDSGFYRNSQVKFLPLIRLYRKLLGNGFNILLRIAKKVRQRFYENKN